MTLHVAALRKKVSILEAIRWVAAPIEKNCEFEVENIERSIRCIDDVREESDDPMKAVDACLLMRSQRPDAEQIEDEVHVSSN